MTGNLDSLNLERKLGITRTRKILTSEPDYIEISLKWYRKFEESGSNDALLRSKHYLNVARELEQAEDEPEITLEFFLE